ncbi:hypothetical protein NNJEOMEG_02550 [Fundidesulfovibrio magnetotacticus]|uniref:Lipoprotein n=1 Tax=Fundidesulfovibrio magnetotacticus TaxID=2730080 RepID=A0A6V8LQA9_9BACT|nr:hypothetical protein [Fundidesulfovibrio magnetotacticus]GFK94703.1 hypothetical protein NNJEOMEG_02550 [Fundidesulfovibrio magnetotacticus]
MRHAHVLTLLAVLVCTPAASRAALTQEQAAPLLLAWIAAQQPGLTTGCLKAVSSQYKNGGFTVTVEAQACGPQAQEAAGQWRIDALTTEVFKARPDGRFAVPPQAQGRPAWVNTAVLAGREASLPPKARVIEATPVPGVQGRAYVLWMDDPKRQEHPRDEEYTCPDYSRGSSWSGPARLSLVDVGTGATRNTLKIADPLEDRDTFDLPWRIPAGPEFAYFVPEPAGKDRAGRPEILRLRDLDGDGQAREFHLSSAGNCMLMLSSVFGYDAARDEAVQYPVDLAVRRDKAAPKASETTWLNFWPLRKEPGPNGWRWEVDTRGRAGCLERFAVRPVREARRFQGELSVQQCEPGD